MIDLRPVVKEEPISLNFDDFNQIDFGFKG